MKKIASFILFSAACFLLNAQTFSCQVRQKELLLGNYTEVEYRFEGGQNAYLAEEPDFSGFNIVGGPNQSSSIRMENGRTDASISVTYLIEPRDTGRFIIPSATMKNEDKTWISEPVAIQVLPNPDQIIEQPAAKANDFFELFGRQFGGGGEPPQPMEKPKNKRKTVRI